MNEQLRYRINSELKNEYDNYIQAEFGQKYSKCGSELEKAMKFYLAANGNSKYQKDPEVQALLKKTQVKTKPKTENINESLEDKIDKLTQKVEQIENQKRREVSKRHGLADFKKQFQMAFNDRHQVTRNELEHFIMNNDDLVDNRSVRNRINYLESQKIIESCVSNKIYNIMF
jgi:hypothetical protein